MEEVQTHRYSLNYKKINMQIFHLWSVDKVFLLKINRLFLIGDANFKMNQK
jgi:hypothetical protein